MPTYAFSCEKCRKTFTQQLRRAEHEKADFSCLQCQSKKVMPQISTFQTKTSRKT